MKKTLIALAILSCGSASFAQETCNGVGACSPVGDNRNGQITTGGSIANGANVQAFGGTGGTSSIIGGAAQGGNVNGGTNTTNVTGGTIGAQTGGTIGATTNTSTSGAATTTSGAATSTAGAATSTSGAASTVGGTANTSNAGVNGQASVTINGPSDAASAANAAATVEAARLAANADIKIRNTPNVGAAVLTSSNDTCMGSFGGGGSGPGFGIQIGSTYKDGNCVMLKNSRELWNMGYRAASLALMCTDAANKEALELSGVVCPQTTRDKNMAQQAATSPVNGYTGSDPIVRARLAQ